MTIAILLAVIFLSNSAVNALTPIVETDFSKADPAVEYLSSQRGISKLEATKRLGWADRASEINDNLISQRTKGFGGMWVDPATDRIVIGLVNKYAGLSETRSEISSMVLAKGLDNSVDYVDVRYGFEELLEKKESILSALERSTEQGKSGFTIGIATDKNQIIIEVPEDYQGISQEDRIIIEDYKNKYKDMFKIEYTESGIGLNSCNWWYCDSPLRGGVEIVSDKLGAHFSCTAGFGVKGNSGAKYILTAGHCQHYYYQGTDHWDLNYWYTNDSSYNYHAIGSVHRNVAHEGSKIDAMIIKTTDIGSWSAVGKIYVRAGIGLGGFTGPSTHEEYDITGYGTSSSLVGDRVCMSGKKSADLNYYEGGSCGPVIMVLTTLEDSPIGLLDGLVKANLCARHGDSGAPVFRLGKALGVVTGGPDNQNDNAACSVSGAPSSPGIVYYTGLQPILNAFNQTISIY